MRAMIRMFTTTYGESVSCTPICDMRRADRPHAERQHVHRPPAHRAAEQLLQLLAHLEGILPVVGRTGVVLRKRADERPVLDARDVARVRARVVTARPQLLVQLDEGAALHHLRAELVIFLLRAIHPMDRRGLGQLGHLLHPSEKMLVGTERLGRVASPDGGHFRSVFHRFRLCNK